jgi:hypothetical protein
MYMYMYMYIYKKHHVPTCILCIGSDWLIDSLSLSLSLSLFLTPSIQASLPLPSLVSVPPVSLVTPWGEPQHWECWGSIPPYLPLASLDYPPIYPAWEIPLQDQLWQVHV